MKKLIMVAMMILSLFLEVSCTNEQPKQEVFNEVTPKVSQKNELKVSSEEIQGFLKDFDNNSDQEYSISEANNKLSVVLFKMLDQDNENLVFSSFSISNALAMAAEATEEEISNSIRTGLRLPKDVNVVREGYHAILQTYARRNKEYSLNIANAVWVDKNYAIEHAKQQNIEKYYLSKAISFDNSQAKVTADKVNKWCDVNTEGMIKEIISAGDIHSLTHLILTNAIYFKGSWQNEFKVKDTSKKTFYSSLNQKSEVDFMYIEEKLAYTVDDNVQVLKMSYRGGDLSMLVVLPKDNDIRALKNKLTSDMLVKWNKELETFKVKVHLPKFKFEYGANLNEPLKKIGMARAFVSKTADELYIDKVLHKAIIDVNEEGTEAAAVTAVAMTTRSMLHQYESREFTADHPFLFVIQDNRNQNILFMGKVEQPEHLD